MTNLVDRLLAENFNEFEAEGHREEISRKTEAIVSHCRLLITSRIGNTDDRKEYTDRFINDKMALFVSHKLLEEIYLFSEKQNESILRATRIKPVDLEKETLDFYDHGLDAGIKITPWPKFSNYFRIAKSELTVFTGIPGHGKSEFVDQLITFLSIYHSWKFAVFSPENYPHCIHNEKLLSKLIGMPFHDGPTKRMERETVQSGLRQLSQNITFISPNDGFISLENVLQLASMEKEDNGLDCLIIDPWNSIENNRPRDRSETEYIGLCLNLCRDYCKRNDIALWIVAHPTKMQKIKDTDIYKVPFAYDIMGSSNWANKCDNILCVYRTTETILDEIQPFVEVHIQKVKHKIRGMTGTVNFNYNKVVGTYSERN